MGKPSIFSKDYEKRMKRRKKAFIIVPILIVIILIVAIILHFKNKMMSNNEKVNQTQSVQKNDKKVYKKEENKTSKNEDKSYEIELSSSKKAKVDYKEEKGVIKYQFVSPLDSGTTFDISPSQELLLINDGSSQNLMLYDGYKKEKDITLKEYVTRDGRSFSKQSILSSSPEYKWCKDAKFLNNNKIVYLSNLPWFGKDDLNTYVWIIDIKTGNQMALMNVKGKNVTFGKLQSKGLEITIDGSTKYLDSNGNLVD